MNSNQPHGNVLGATRAELDSFMLERAFVETTAFASLAHTRDFNFVVGRRGTGKSALCARLVSHFGSQHGTIVIKHTPQEHEAVEFQSVLERQTSNYSLLRTISRVVFKIHTLIDILLSIKSHHKFAKTEHATFLCDFLTDNRELAKIIGMARCVSILRNGKSVEPKEIAGALAAKYRIEQLRSAMQSTINELGKNIVILYDGLDEGWLPEVSATATLGGLAKAAAELVESSTRIYPLLFVRDNMYRALGEFDGDFTRHIEGNTIRLHWDESSLLRLVSERLRISLNLEQENDVKIWNRFAQRKLEGREGFRACLQYTLYRPRDILTLLNESYQTARRNGRLSIIEEDLNESAVRISKNRLDDLIKEYDAVLPGLKFFVKIFSGGQPFMAIRDALRLLDNGIAQVDYSQSAERDFAIFEESKDIFFALYSVGFLGVKSESTNSFVFCHDGSLSSPEDLIGDRLTSVHPCYWKALNLSESDDLRQETIVQVNDEYDHRPREESSTVQELRTTRLGTVADELPRVKLGRDGGSEFEKWVFRSVRVLFAGKLSAPELRPNIGVAQKQSIIVTNTAEHGFWRRIREEYGAKQVVFECANCEALGPDEFRQPLSYSTAEYGKFLIICTRALNENITTAERAWIRAMYHEQERVMMLIPAEIFSRCLRKLRNSNRNNDYTEEQFGKRMDWILGTVINLPQRKKFRSK
jgi:hypothetical protein